MWVEAGNGEDRRSAVEILPKRRLGHAAGVNDHRRTEAFDRPLFKERIQVYLETRLAEAPPC